MLFSFSKPAYKEINPREVATKLNNPAYLIIDVREPHEYHEGHIPGSELIPLNTLPNHTARLERQKTLVLVCRSGRRSASAANYLAGLGFEKIYNLQGGMLEWLSYRLPTEK
jgi:rhodanese-related sulfurtransferase